MAAKVETSGDAVAPVLETDVAAAAATTTNGGDDEKGVADSNAEVPPGAAPSKVAKPARGPPPKKRAVRVAPPRGKRAPPRGKKPGARGPAGRVAPPRGKRAPPRGKKPGARGPTGRGAPPRGKRAPPRGRKAGRGAPPRARPNAAAGERGPSGSPHGKRPPPKGRTKKAEATAAAEEELPTVAAAAGDGGDDDARVAEEEEPMQTTVVAAQQNDAEKDDSATGTQQPAMDVCAACDKPLGKSYVSALGQCYHKECLVCSECSTALGADVPCIQGNDGKPYCTPCERRRRGEVCSVCDEVLTQEFVAALGKRFHKECFCCSSCQGVLDAGKGAVFQGRDDNKLYCKPCAPSSVLTGEAAEAPAGAAEAREKERLAATQALFAGAARAHLKTRSSFEATVAHKKAKRKSAASLQNVEAQRLAEEAATRKASEAATAALAADEAKAQAGREVVDAAAAKKEEDRLAAEAKAAEQEAREAAEAARAAEEVEYGRAIAAQLKKDMALADLKAAEEEELRAAAEMREIHDSAKLAEAEAHARATHLGVELAQAQALEAERTSQMEAKHKAELHNATVRAEAAALAAHAERALELQRQSAMEARHRAELHDVTVRAEAAAFAAHAASHAEELARANARAMQLESDLEAARTDSAEEERLALSRILKAHLAAQSVQVRLVEEEEVDAQAREEAEAMERIRVNLSRPTIDFAAAHRASPVSSPWCAAALRSPSAPSTSYVHVSRRGSVDITPNYRETRASPTLPTSPTPISASSMAAMTRTAALRSPSSSPRERIGVVLSRPTMSVAAARRRASPSPSSSRDDAVFRSPTVPSVHVSRRGSVNITLNSRGAPPAPAPPLKSDWQISHEAGTVRRRGLAAQIRVEQRRVAAKAAGVIDAPDVGLRYAVRGVQRFTPTEVQSTSGIMCVEVNQRFRALRAPTPGGWLLVGKEGNSEPRGYIPASFVERMQTRSPVRAASGPFVEDIPFAVPQQQDGDVERSGAAYVGGSY